MAMWEEKNGLLRPYGFGYDAVDQDAKKRRRAPKTTTSYEDDELSAFKRRKLIATTRDLQRNFAIAGWAIRKHLDYVSTFNFQCRSSDNSLNQRIENLMTWWSRAENCDVAGRHCFPRLVRIMEECRAVDGDLLVMQLSSGEIQLVEGDRIQDGARGNQSAPGGAFLNGVELDAAGRAIRYAVSRREPGSTVLTLERYVSADFSKLFGYYDRVDQVRGISRIAPAINHFQDLYEGITYALAKAKVAQMFGLITYRHSNDALGLYGDAPSGGNGYDINFGSVGGPFHLDLDDGDEAKILESQTPSTQFQDFTREVIALALKSLDIPYSFYNESFTNYSGARQALLQYEQSVQAKRVDLVEVLDWITEWKIAQWVAAGLLDLKGRRLRDIPWEWVPAGIPWIDPLKEVEADTKAVEQGFKSRQMVAKERGQDYYTIVDQLKQEQDYASAQGVTLGASKGVPNAISQ
jgi:lambda family phage portal protein